MLFASRYWRYQAITDHLDPEPFDYALLFAIHDEISAGQRHRDDIRVAAAGNLRQGPALTRFTSELQRTVNPDYRWNPGSHHRKFPPITQWIMDQIETARNPDSHRPSGWQPPPEHYEAATDIPRPRGEASIRPRSSTARAQNAETGPARAFQPIPESQCEPC